MYDITPRSWYEEDYPSKTQYLVKHCPVCKTIFQLDPDGDLMAYCEECDYNFYFRKSRIKPYKNEKPPKKCHCANCSS